MVARCARRIAAKMLADQATKTMLSIVAIENTGAGPHEDFDRDFDSEDLTIVLVSRGSDARRVLAWLESQTKKPRPFDVEVERDRGPT
jgi:microcompartment protein CcmK/EutM